MLIQYQAAAELERCKVDVKSATEPIDRKTASGRLTFGMLVVIAKVQSDQLSEKVRRSQTTKATDRTTPDAAAPITSRLFQLALFPRMSPHLTPSATLDISSRPPMSSAVRGPNDSGML